jgi:hypothetical protein
MHVWPESPLLLRKRARGEHGERVETYRRVFFCACTVGSRGNKEQILTGWPRTRKFASICHVLRRHAALHASRRGLTIASIKHLAAA